MRETLYIRLNAGQDDAPVAYRIDGEEPGRVEHAPLADALGHAAGRRVVGFAPAEAMRLQTVELPVRQMSRVRQAVPYLLEDQLAEDIETLHFAVSPRGDDGQFAVAVVAHEQMSEWMELFRAHGVNLSQLVPDVLALPAPEAHRWVVGLGPDRALVRTTRGEGFACAAAMVSTYLEFAAPPSDLTLEMHIVGHQDAPSGIEHEFELLPGYADLIEPMISGLRAGVTVDLLQGPYSQRESLRRYWRPWVVPAALAAGLAVLALTATWVDTWRLNARADAREVANIERFQALFPGETRIVDLRVQLQQKLAGDDAGDAVAFLPLLEVLGAALDSASGLTLRGVQFRDGDMYLDLRGDDLQALESLNAWFDQREDAKAEVQTANAGSDGVQIRIKLSRVA